MKKFRFKLETLLSVTRRKKEDAERLFVEATRILEEERARLAVYLEEMQKAQAEYTEQTKEGKRISVGRLMTYTSYVNWKRQQIEQQQQVILEAQNERQKRLKELLEMMSKLKAIEQLKETTQLIVISHQRRTMEQADILYGVSMQADGVSHVVSQRLDRTTGKVVEA